MPSSSYASGIRQFNMWLHRQDDSYRDELKGLLRDTHTSFDGLQEIFPSFATEWARYQHALRQYLDIIEAGGLQVWPDSTTSSQFLRRHPFTPRTNLQQVIQLSRRGLATLILTTKALILSVEQTQDHWGW